MDGKALANIGSEIKQDIHSFFSFITFLMRSTDTMKNISDARGQERRSLIDSTVSRIKDTQNWYSRRERVDFYSTQSSPENNPLRPFRDPNSSQIPSKIQTYMISCFTSPNYYLHYSINPGLSPPTPFFQFYRNDDSFNP